MSSTWSATHAGAEMASALTLLQATLDAAADGILVLDLNGRVIGRNRTFELLWRVPAPLRGTEDGEALLDHMCTLLLDPAGFRADVASMTGVPLASGRGEMRTVDDQIIERYTTPQMTEGAVRGRVWTFRDVTLERRMRADLERQAFSDALTGLANRARFMAVLEETIVCALGDMAVCLIDLDGFKYVNDGLGHRAGDAVLREVARRLREVLPEARLVARIGGDEFGVIFARADPERVADRCAAAVARISEVMAVPGGRARVGASAGWTLLRAGHRLDADRFLHQADLAMYRAKQAGRAQVCEYTDELTRVNPQAAWEEVTALLADPGGLTVAFQPICDLSNGRTYAFEALARFPGREHRSTPEWFAMAHAVGLGGALEARAVSVALRDGAARPPGTLLSVNVSPAVLTSRRARQALGGDLSGVIVEVTEDAGEDLADLIKAAKWLASRGALLAMDDAGEGYSGLRRLLDLKPHIVKLDRQLIRGIDLRPDKAALVEALVSFCARTGARLCAEGIEEASELSTLADLGVELCQGFFIGTPGPSFEGMSPLALDHCGVSAVAPGDLAPALARLAQARRSHELVRALDYASAALGTEAITVCTFDGDRLTDLMGRLSQRVGHYRVRDYPVTAQCLATRRCIDVHVDDPAADPSEVRWLAELGFDNVLLIPVFLPHSEAIGLIEAYGNRPDRWTVAEIAVAQRLAAGTAEALHRVIDSAAPQGGAGCAESGHG